MLLNITAGKKLKVWSGFLAYESSFLAYENSFLAYVGLLGIVFMKEGIDIELLHHCVYVNCFAQKTSK